MKSLTLHLIVILLLGSLQYNAVNLLPRTTVAAATASSSSSSAIVPTAIATTRTTLQPPSLQKPQRYYVIPTTATTAATTAMTSIKRRQLAAHATIGEDDAAQFDSARLVRNATKIIARKQQSQQQQNSVRQNRSLQSNSNAAENSNSNNSDDKKYKRLQRRQPFRSNQHSSSSSSIATAAAAEATKSPSPQEVAAIRTSSSSSEQQQQTSQPSFMASHRQSKQQQHHEVQQQHQQVAVDDAAVESQDLSKQQQQRRTTKTPRMIQRLVAGHIQNAEGHFTYEISAVSSNSTISNSTTTLKPNALYFRRKPEVLSSSYRQSRLGSTSTTTTTMAPMMKLKTITPAADERDDDEALLDDPGDFDNWDHGILRLSAGSGKENSPKSKKNKEDSKKTLSDQVRDGKYGLIEKELFRRQPKRPGVLSYLPNKEVPVDNERNFGGLNEEDIWLAEDHLLVIKGGSLNEDEPDEPWPAIDDYDAPGRQIKIPTNPKVPPPFPVQLEENGPLQFIGNNKFTVVYPVANETVPVYTAGVENNYASSESDDEKNLLTRPGATEITSTEAEPGYLYPAPYPPWLYHNQTFVNPTLKNARPISFPGLGPFPFRRNGSLENVSGNDTADYFDEDDPSLYYPPAYSFVYKNNYSNPVPPGPLVPGIVLPPPPEQFSRLEKHSKGTTTTTTTAPITVTALPPRQRIYTTSTTTSTTSTTTTTTEVPFRQVLTKITEYTPKTITITAATPKARPLPETPPPTSAIIEPVPVPVAVPVPIYPSKHYSTKRPNTVSFVPTTAEPAVETFSKSNPIYYEYFEAKREPTTTNVIDDFISTTTAKPTLSGKPIKIYATSKRPFKQHHRNYLQPLSANRPFVQQDNVVYITPKPEIRPQYNYPQAPIYKPRPLENFEREVNAIRETLRFYQNQQLRDNNIPRTPKAKTIYEYSFDATKGEEDHSPEPNNNFQAPAEFDEEPFKPMVTYSPPVDDENAFRAIAYEKADREPLQQQPAPKYQSTTTLIPVQPSPQYQVSQGRPKKLRLGAAKYLEQSLHGNNQQQQYPFDYQSTPRTILTTEPPWVSLDKQQPRVEYPQEPPQSPPPQSQHHSVGVAPKNRGFNGYYYGPPPPPHRQNNRFYDEPFQNPVRKIINNYQPPPPPQQQQQQQYLPQQQQQNVWSLENDTYVNYAPNRPPLNPDAEFISPYQNIPLNPYAQQQQQRYGPLPPPLSHQSQYYGPPQRYPIRQQAPQSQSQSQVPLHRDILVNYRQPLPPINPDSEYISHPQVVRNQPQQIYRPNAYRLPSSSQQATAGDQQSNIYYITPKYRRGSNGNQNNNNNNAHLQHNNGNRP